MAGASPAGGLSEGGSEDLERFSSASVVFETSVMEIVGWIELDPGFSGLTSAPEKSPPSRRVSLDSDRRSDACHDYTI